MKRPSFETMIHLGIGVSWFIALAGATAGFFYIYDISLVAAVSGAVLGFTPGLFAILFTEAIYIHHQNLNEQKKQTKILEEIQEKLTSR